MPIVPDRNSRFPNLTAGEKGRSEDLTPVRVTTSFFVWVGEDSELRLKLSSKKNPAKAIKKKEPKNRNEFFMSSSSFWNDSLFFDVIDYPEIIIFSARLPVPSCGLIV
jgi:hypothetical protein